MKKLLTAVLLSSAGIAVPAAAAPITYKLAGTFTGTRAGNPFTVFATFTGLGDTANTFSAFGNPAATGYLLSSLTALTGDNETFTITQPTFFYAYGPGQYGNEFGRLGLSFDNSGGNALGLESPAFTGYNGSTSFPTSPGITYFQNAGFQTNGGFVAINSFTGGTFQALAAVPEPATWGMKFVVALIAPLQAICRAVVEAGRPDASGRCKGCKAKPAEVGGVFCGDCWADNAAAP